MKWWGFGGWGNASFSPGKLFQENEIHVHVLDMIWENTSSTYFKNAMFKDAYTNLSHIFRQSTYDIVDGGRYFTLHNGIELLQQIREIRVYKR